MLSNDILLDASHKLSIEYKPYLLSSFRFFMTSTGFLRINLGNIAEAYDRTMKEAIQLTKYVLPYLIGSCFICLYVAFSL